MPPHSYWMTSAPSPQFPPLGGNSRTEVAVVGGGIVGIMTAFLLQQAGHAVTLIEARRLAGQVTGHTTAKVTSQHGLIYADLAKRHGRDKAEAYGRSQQAALALMTELIEQHAIDCDIERVDAHVYCCETGNIRTLQDEADAAASLGLPAEFVDRCEAPFPALAAVRFRDQAQFHPRKYLLALARMAQEAGCHIHEQTRVTDVTIAPSCRIDTDRGRVSADHVVLATHMPILDRGGFFALAYPFAHVALAARLDGPAGIRGMYISVEEPTRSVRLHHGEGGAVLIASGGSFKAGKSDAAGEMAALEGWVAKHFPVRAVEQRWTNHDLQSADRLPLIGPLSARTPNVHVATGFAAWGMTGGTVAAMVLSDAIRGRDNPWAATYDSTRRTAVSGLGAFIKENADVARTWMRDHVTSGDKRTPESLGPGEAAVLDGARGKVAAHRDAEGRLHVVQAACSHMGCTVQWNSVARTWDCPCHGSRFEPDGRVLFGPAVKPLAAAEAATEPAARARR